MINLKLDKAKEANISKILERIIHKKKEIMILIRSETNLMFNAISVKKNVGNIIMSVNLIFNAIIT